MLTDEATRQVRHHLALIGRPPTAQDIASALQATGQVISDTSVWAVGRGIAEDSAGIGPLEPLLGLAGLTDIVVNGPDQVFIDRGQGLEPAEVSFPDDEAVRHLGARLAALVGRRLDDGSPFVDARLPNGIRFHAVLGPIADPGTCLSLRVPSQASLSIDDWVASGACDRHTGLFHAGQDPGQRDLDITHQ